MNGLTGLILAGDPEAAGGTGRIALTLMEGEPVVCRQVKEMRKVCDEVIVAAPNAMPFLKVLDPQVRLITDYEPSRGPLSGMYAGLCLAKRSRVWVVGCDRPYLSADAARLLAERLGEADAAIPQLPDGPHPLHAVYAKRCADRVWSLIAEGGRKPAALPDVLVWKAVTADAFAERGIPLRFAETWRPHSAADGPEAWRRDANYGEDGAGNDRSEPLFPRDCGGNAV